MAKPTIVQDVFTVKRKQFITPNFIRITLTGNVAIFKDATLGDNNKIFIPPKGISKVHMRTYDPIKEQIVLPPKEVLPYMRTYTHRGINLEKNELTIDFANHGLNGPASAWAIQATEGAELGVAMKVHKKELYPISDWYLLVGDTTAIPVISVILESLPNTAKGVCIIEVHGKEDEQQLRTNAEVDFIWLHNPEPKKGSNIADEVKKVIIPDSSKFGFVACEFSSVKAIRSYLRKELQWTKEELYAYSYWKAGFAEDKSADDRRSERNG